MERLRTDPGFIGIAATIAALMVAAPAAAQEAAARSHAAVAHPPASQEEWPEHAVQQQIQNIVRDRPPQAENAARAFLYHIAPSRECSALDCPVLDSLRARNADAYWREVAQLTIQFDMFQRVVSRDSARARVMAAMFASEFEARAIQRSWRTANEAERRALRTRLEFLMLSHVEAEDELRALEIRDIERRLADVRAESERRRQRRAELVRWSVDDIIHGAERPDY